MTEKTEQNESPQDGCAPATGSEGPTPRTDKNTWTTIAGAFACRGANGDLEGKGEYVPTAFARQLERELNQVLECLSGAEWALTDACNKDRIGWVQEQARDEARAMLERCAANPQNDQAEPLPPDSERGRH